MKLWGILLLCLLFLSAFTHSALFLCVLYVVSERQIPQRKFVFAEIQENNLMCSLLEENYESQPMFSSSSPLHCGHRLLASQLNPHGWPIGHPSTLWEPTLGCFLFPVHCKSVKIEAQVHPVWQMHKELKLSSFSSYLRVPIFT